MSRYVSDKLVHLSDEQIDNMLNEYYQKNKVSELIKKYNIDITSSKFVTILPYEVNFEGLVCDYCGEQVYIKYLSRNSFDTEEYICRSCGHMPNRPRCACNGCKNKAKQNAVIERKKQESEEQQNEMFIRIWLEIDAGNAVYEDTLTFEQKVYLGAFLREGIYEDYSCIKPINFFTTPIAPTFILQEEIVDELKNNKLIKIHPNTEVKYFNNINIEKRTASFEKTSVWWQLNVKSLDMAKVPLVDSIMNPNFEFDNNEAYLLWRKIALHESIEYLKYNIQQLFDIDYNVGEKTISVINDLIKHYSVAQIYYIIYSSTNNALRYREEKSIPNKQAANSIIGRMQSLGERALNNGWELGNYKRCKDCPQSLISKFFFERILKINEDGFNQKPHVINRLQKSL